MRREEAKAIIRKEYLCVDRDCDIERSCGKCDLMMSSKEPILEAYSMAIKALEQEPCKDANANQHNSNAVKDVGQHINALELEVRQAVLNMWRQIICYDRPCCYRDEGRCTETYCDFKLFEYEINHMPPVKPQYTDDEIQKMQDLEQAEIQKAYALGQADRPTGQWVEENINEWSRKVFCSECGCPSPFEHISNGDIYSASGYGVNNKTKFCPNCGCAMVEPQERSGEK